MNVRFKFFPTTVQRVSELKTDIRPESVYEACHRIEGLAHQTPVMTCESISQRVGAKVFFKCENFQKVGAFKFRGALNAIKCLSQEELDRGVITHSSGNHAQALALAARLMGVRAQIVMPTAASPVKRQAVLGYGGEVIDCGPGSEAREAKVHEVQLESGATLIPPFDHPDVIAGQGTAAKELLDEVGTLDLIVAPIGGGGLISGTCLAIAAAGVNTRVVAAEPKRADDAYRSKQLGKIVPQEPPDTIADGLLTQLGRWTWPFVRDQVECVITVSEDEIVAAMRLCWERAKLLIEPSSAVALAAVLSQEFKQMPPSERIGIILSGGNVNLDNLPW